MVAINFTIVVQLVLFLTFLWVTNKLVLRPILRVMDERDRTNRENQEASERDTERAQKLESDYAAQIASARRQGVVTVEKARREALNERMQALAARKQAAEDQVAVEVAVVDRAGGHDHVDLGLVETGVAHRHPRRLRRRLERRAPGIIACGDLADPDKGRKRPASRPH